MRSSSQNFRQFALFLCLFLPSHAAAGDDWDCGDWACSNYGLAITNAKTRSGRESYLVFVPEEKIPDNCSEPNHAIFFSEKNNLKSAFEASELDFIFDDGSSVRVPVVALTDNKIQLAPLSETPKLESYLREKNSFEIVVEDQIFSGPYSLWGSNRAISSIALVCR